MPKTYIVKQGDCISSIAFKYNLFPDVIWDHSDNANLKNDRKDPNALFPGDKVVIPDKREKEEECETGQTHRFRRKGVPEKLRILFSDDEDESRSGVPYVIDVRTKSGRPVPLERGETDDDGLLDISIPPDVNQGEIRLGEGDEQEVINLGPGDLDPANTISGAIARLKNMGYDCGEHDDRLDEDAIECIRLFQKRYDLPLIDDGATKIEQETIDKIEEIYSRE